MTDRKSYDVAVIGAGTFGAWTAYYLAKSGASVALLDAYGPANSRASSGGESRIIRMGYGADEIYTRWSLRALPRWKEIFAAAGRPELFQPTGVLWIAHDKYPYAMDTLTALQNHKVPHERLSLMGLRKHYPQIAFDDDAWGILEPESGVLMARRAVQTVVEQSQKIGVQYRAASALAPFGEGRVSSIMTTHGENISAGAFVYACGPWLGETLPRPSGPAHLRLPPGSYFFRSATRRHSIPAGGPADMAISEGRILRHARFGKSRPESCRRPSWPRR